MRRFTSFFIGLIMMAGILLPLPSFAFSEKENGIKISAAVDEHISYSEKNGSLTATTNIKNGYWIIDNHIVISKY